MTTFNQHAESMSNPGGKRDEAFARLVEQMRQYFSLADFLPVGEDAVSPMGELTAPRMRPTPGNSGLV